MKNKLQKQYEKKWDRLHAPAPTPSSAPPPPCTKEDGNKAMPGKKGGVRTRWIEDLVVLVLLSYSDVIGDFTVVLLFN